MFMMVSGAGVITALEDLRLGMDGFNARMQRPRLPAGIFAVEISYDMTALLTNHKMTLLEYVEAQLKKTFMDNYSWKK